ncbi:alpha/beta hydrolase [Ruficoccus amylovorans]|uniref:Alpha/beta hydrolase n=1 Tax=Ruficoccus amylovorans TaxID=1804625 RepID=A0A842HII5_9BACT|nr:alpha/beta hydrolase [Ruficoccus amylovorans]MBC2595384.1 alpha/beta hydrolase [Ruficoccus amylovorans]
MYFRLLPATAALLALMFTAGAAFAQSATPGPYAKVVKDVAYKATSPANVLDLYYPQSGEAPYPTHIYLHGGGWTGGGKNLGPNQKLVFEQLAQQGFLGIAVEYQLVDAAKDRYMRTCAVDCMDALRYIFAHADELGVDPENVFVWGGSAGGQLALLCATAPISALQGDNPNPEGGAPIRAVVAWYPPTDMLEYEPISVEFNKNLRDLSKRIGRTVEDDPVAFIEISPLAHLTRKDPPALLIHGDADSVVHLEHSRRFKDKADTLGVPCELVVVENANHVFRPVGGKQISPDLNTISELTADFFVDHVASPAAEKPLDAVAH